MGTNHPQMVRKLSWAGHMLRREAIHLAQRLPRAGTAVTPLVSRPRPLPPRLCDAWACSVTGHEIQGHSRQFPVIQGGLRDLVPSKCVKAKGTPGCWRIKALTHHLWSAWWPDVNANRHGCNVDGTSWWLWWRHFLEWLQVHVSIMYGFFCCSIFIGSTRISISALVGPTMAVAL